MSHTDANGKEINNGSHVSIGDGDGGIEYGTVVTAGAFKSLVRFGNEQDWYSNDRLTVMG